MRRGCGVTAAACAVGQCDVPLHSSPSLHSPWPPIPEPASHYSPRHSTARSHHSQPHTTAHPTPKRPSLHSPPPLQSPPPHQSTPPQHSPSPHHNPCHSNARVTSQPPSATASLTSQHHLLQGPPHSRAPLTLQPRSFISHPVQPPSLNISLQSIDPLTPQPSSHHPRSSCPTKHPSSRVPGHYLQTGDGPSKHALGTMGHWD